MSETQISRPRLLIIGAGFGGLEAARALRQHEVEITLIDRRNHHLFQPLLYQVATAALSPGEIAWPIRSIFRDQKNLTVLLGEVTGIDGAARLVRSSVGDIPYDMLVVATGATHAYFGHDDWAPFAPGLKSIEDATSLRSRLLGAFERAEAAADPNEQAALLTFAVVGGGPTGVEMAGAVAELAFHALPGEFRRADPKRARVLLIEAGPRILPPFPERLSAVARKSLEAMGVEVMTGAAVEKCDAEGVVVGGTFIPARTIVWAAGVRASPAAAWLGAAADRAGRVQVAPDLSLPGQPEVFVIGDTAAITDAQGQRVPGVAPAAKQMGQYVGKLIAARLSGKPAPKPFVYSNYGDLATIGRRSAVVSLGKFRMTGFPAWVFWGLAHVFYLIGFRSRFAVTFHWIWSYLTFQRGTRLITRSTGQKAAGD